MILTDAGPLLAIINQRDPNHERCVGVILASGSQSMITTWPAFTEAMHIAGKSAGFHAQRLLWRLRDSGSLEFHDLSPAEIDLAANYMAKYHDLPLDLADASLLAAADALDTRQLFTLDSDFYILRLSDGSPLELIPQPPQR